LLNDVGVEISKRQVVRFLTERLDGFHAEDAAVLHTGLVSASYVTVDDTGARHANRNFHTTHIGSKHFTAFRTASSKSRLNFLALLRGNNQDYVLNDAAFALLEDRQVDPALAARLRRRKPQLLRVLERPEIPLHTNASERDLRGFVLKRKISGGTVSRNGRLARDSMLGLMKTCQKLGLSFWHYLGERLGVGIDDHPVSPLPSLVAARA
jgi:hypothetical protein